jgi:DNA ligase (NAD+)
VEDSKNIPFERVLYALGIRYVGETVAKNWRSIIKILMHYVKQLMDLILVDEIGEKIAKSVLSFLIMKKIKSSLTD